MLVLLAPIFDKYAFNKFVLLFVKYSYPINPDPVTMGVVIRSLPIHSNRFTKLEPKAPIWSIGQNGNLIPSGVMRRHLGNSTGHPSRLDKRPYIKKHYNSRNYKSFSRLLKQYFCIFYDFRYSRSSYRKKRKCNLFRDHTFWDNLHFAKNSSTTSAVSSYTLSNVPITSLATRLISGTCRAARDSSRRAFLVATFFITFTKPASFRSESP
jgi:hypothetical protein